MVLTTVGKVKNITGWCNSRQSATLIVLMLVNAATKARGPLAPHAEAELDRFWAL